MHHAFVHHNGIHHQKFPGPMRPTLPDGSYIYTGHDGNWYEIRMGISCAIKPEEVPKDIRTYLLLVI